MMPGCHACEGSALDLSPSARHHRLVHHEGLPRQREQQAQGEIRDLLREDAWRIVDWDAEFRGPDLVDAVGADPHLMTALRPLAFPASSTLRR